MKKLCILLSILVFKSGIVYASENFFNEDWWKTATVEGVKAEIANGADVNAKDVLDKTKGFTALMFAATSNENPEIIKILIDAGADVNAKIESEEIKGVTVLMIAAASNENPEVIKILIDAGADVNAKIESGETKDGTALMYAIFMNKNPEVIKVLIDAGADVNAKNDDGDTALMEAACENIQIVKMLIDAGADVNAKNDDGDTALMKAARENIQIVKMLIDAGADVNAKDTYGHTALYYARLFEKQEIMEFLQAYQSNFNEFDEMFAECYSTQNIGSYANKFCECAIKTAIKALGVEDQQKAQDAFENARAGTFKNLIQKGKSAAFNECY